MSTSKSRGKKRFVGVDLGGTNVRAGLVDRDRLIDVRARAIRSHGTKDEVFADLCEVIDQVIDKSVRGIGIGAPSLVDRGTGTLHDTVNIPAWKSVPIKSWLEKRYGVPVQVDNDANCFALGEHRFGVGKGKRNLVGLILGTGFGAGIISNGQLHSGTDCAAGEFGMIPYRDSVLEHYASGQLFKKFGYEGATLAKLAKSGDEKAQSLFDEYGKHLAFGVKTILYSLAPELIVLGGSVSRSRGFFKRAFEESMADFAYERVRKRVAIKVSKLEHVAVLGAASLVE